LVRGACIATKAFQGTLAHLEFLDDNKVLILSGDHIDTIIKLAEVLPVFDKDLGWDLNADPNEDAGAITWFKSAFADLSQVSITSFQSQGNSPFHPVGEVHQQLRRLRDGLLADHLWRL
jgi:hypothetical protein